MKNRATIGMAFTLILLFVGSMAAPMRASADNYWGRQNQLQSNKNTSRNIAIGGLALAGVGLLTHDNTLAVVGAGTAVISGEQYEQDRQRQSRDQNDWGWRGGRDYGYVCNR